jgi:hypothetical protein
VRLAPNHHDAEKYISDTSYKSSSSEVVGAYLARYDIGINSRSEIEGSFRAYVLDGTLETFR